MWSHEFPKYKQNLKLVEDFDGNYYIKSYDTHVARIEDKKIVQLGWWSVTTQKHINYAAQQLGLELVKP